MLWCGGCEGGTRGSSYCGYAEIVTLRPSLTPTETGVRSTVDWEALMTFIAFRNVNLFSLLSMYLAYLPPIYLSTSDKPTVNLPARPLC